MKKGLLGLVFAVLFLNLLALGLFSAIVPAHAATDAPQPEIVVQINIPGVTFECAQQPGKLCVRSFGEYISGFYRFFAGAISIIAAVIVMWGGIKWATASGNASRAKDAKDTIYSAIIALVITFGSYVLLYTINPQIVKLELPNVNSIVGIQQGGGGCSDYPLSSIDTTTGCNPKTTECCGQSMNVDLGGGKTDTCTWDVCSKRDEVCWLGAYKPIEGLKGSGCVPVQSEIVPADRNWCSYVDGIIQKSKTVAGAQKFQYTGSGFKYRSWSFGPFGGEDSCIWSVTLDKFFRLFPTEGPSGYQKKFVACYTQGAKGVCWDTVDGAPRTLDCNGNKATPCSDPNAVPRPVAGAAGGCLVKDGADGSANKDDYYCWSVPRKDPRVVAPDGWGSPPSF